MSEADSSDTSSVNDEPNFGAPFDATDADVVLRSCDGVDFRAHRAVLTHASPFFASMFSLPTPSSDGLSSDEWKDDLPVVVMSEDMDPLFLLLSLCYPALRCAIPTTFDEVTSMIHLIDKFDMPGAVGYAVAGLRLLVSSNPHRAYALGWKLQSKEVIRAAALETLAQPLTKTPGPDLPEYAHLPTVAFHQLLAYHHRCSARLSRINQANLRWLDYNDFPMPAKSDTVRCCKQDVFRTFASSIEKKVKSWWLQYLEYARNELQYCLRGSAARSYKALGNTLLQGIAGITCHSCRECASVVLESISKLLADHVEKVIVEELQKLENKLPF